MAGGLTGAAGRGRQDLFVSYAGPDRPWAEWAAAALEGAGYTVELDVWDWSAGDSFVLRMEDALARADCVLALWSASYFESGRFTSPEWQAAFVEAAHEPGARRIVPVRVAEVTPPRLLQPLIYRDVFDLDEAAARDELVAAVAGPDGRQRPHPFPGRVTTPDWTASDGPRMPGTRPPIWNVPPRNLGFTGRQAVLAGLREHLVTGERAWVQALNGISGVGKTQVAVEYAHLFAGEYDLAWWIDAERPELLGEQLAALATAAGWTSPAVTLTTSEVAAIVRARLGDRGRWLLVFDNVENPAHLDGWLLDGPGHVIVTSRRQAWAGVASPVGVEVFSRTESIDLLRTRVPTLTRADADAVANALGDLPLAIAQAAGLLAETRMPVTEYLEELHTHGSEILSEGRPTDYPHSLAGTIETSLGRLAAQDPAATDLLHVAAVLAPQPIPHSWFRAAPADLLPASVGAMTERHLAWRRTLAHIANLGLAQVTTDTLLLHRLTQAVLRDQRTPDQLAVDRTTAARIVSAAAPEGFGRDPAAWTAWATFLPHLLALDPATGPRPLRATARRAQWYLIERGDYAAAVHLAETWRRHWAATDGPDGQDLEDLEDLSIHLAYAYKRLGRYQEAYDLDRVTYDTRRRVLGPDHPDTLASAGQLAGDMRGLGRRQEAYDLDRATHDTRRRVLGPDHPDTLSSAGNLAYAYRLLGRYLEAYDLDRATHDADLRVLGPDHPDTLSSASHLAADLRGLGRHQEAYDLDRATHNAFRRLLGPDHPYTLNSAGNLAADLRGLGRHQEAYDLDRASHDAYRRVLGPDHPDTLTSASNLAVHLSGMGRHQEAYDLDRVTYDAFRRLFGPDHPDTLTSASNLAVTLRNVGRHQEAENLRQATHDTCRRVLGPDHPVTLASASNLAIVLRGLGLTRRLSGKRWNWLV